MPLLISPPTVPLVRSTYYRTLQKLPIQLDTLKPLGDPARNITSVEAGFKFSKVDISLKKTVEGNRKRNVGDTVTFLILVKREDPISTSVNLVVKDSLSANLEFVSVASCYKRNL